MALKVELQNIGGLRGDHTYEIGKGLNVLKAPNATGKSSLLNAIFLIAGNKYIDTRDLQRFLTDNEISGFARLTDEQGKKSEVRLTRDLKKGVSISKVDVQEPFTSDMGVFASFLREQSKINQGIQAADDTMIENWFLDVTKVSDWFQAYTKAQDVFNEFESVLDDLKDKHGQDVQNIKALIEKKKAEILKLIARKQEIEADPKLQNNKRRLSDIDKELKPLNDQIKLTRNSLATITAELDTITREIGQKAKDIETLEKEYKNIQSVRAKLLTEKERVEKIIKEKTEAVARLKVRESEVHDESKELYGRIQQLSGLKGRSECPTCYQAIDRTKNEKSLKEAETLYEKSKLAEEKARREKEAANRDLRLATDELKEIEKQIKIRPEEIKDRLDKADKDKKSLEKRRALKDAEKASEQKKHDDIKIEIEKKEEERRGCFTPEITKELKAIDVDVDERERSIQAQEAKLKEFEADNLEIPKAEHRVTAAKAIMEHYRGKFDRVKKDLIKRINEKLKRSFELLKLAELERITIEPEHFKIDIQRADKSYTTLQKMCGAERALISLIIAFAVKATLWDEAPLFMVDEVTSEMDDARFKSAIKSISEEIPYLIVARHSPFAGTKIPFAEANIANTL